MTLNKQRILSELGSVMSQLQSADCGCMGKLFSNPNQNGQAPMGSPLPTCGGCRRGCCHGRGYNNPCNNGTPSAGEPYSMPHSMQSSNMTRPCMGQCNPPKLYADTYNYLNDNLMQPVVQEVYNDLKSITPDNTVVNNPLATQMGLAHGSVSNASNNNTNMAHNSGITSAGNLPNSPGMNGLSNMNSMSMEQSSPPANLGGMGPQIVNMVMGSGSAKQKMPLSDQIVSSQPLNQTEVTSFTPASFPNLNQVTGNLRGQYGSNIEQNQYNANASNMSSFNNNYMTQPNAYTGVNGQSPTMAIQGNTAQNNVPAGNMPLTNANPAVQQMATSKSYGQHAHGMMKFNEIFPGVMQDGDLGFDPMAIAIQMNPANQQKVAMDTMNKLFNNTPTNRVMGQTSTNQHKMSTNAQPQQLQNNLSSGDQLKGQQIEPIDKIVTQENVPGQQLINTQQQHQIYSETVGAPTAYQQQIFHQQSENQQQQNQAMVTPNIGTVNGHLTLPGNESIRDPNGQIQPTQVNPQTDTLLQNMVRDPILPVDTSKALNAAPVKAQKQYQYNTLGQPIQMLPARLYHPPQSDLPQTLSPQPISKLRNDPMRYSNVKSTVSKTSLMGNKPTLSTPSRSQLQHIYNQYKGSQSFTQQNLKSPVQGGTFSDGKLNVNRANVNATPPLEKVGGDTLANNHVHGDDTTNKAELVMGQIGDVPTSHKPQGDSELAKATSIPTRQTKCRNGLQDVVYTSYPSSAAWSFHGRQEYRPFTTGYRFTK